jgi:phosphoribosylformylglycinamidine cyclo-ligase
VLDVEEWGEEMLTPTKIYVKPVMEMLGECEVHGLAHITGGAFSKLMRLNKKYGFEIEEPMEPQGIFREIGKHVGSEVEMYRTFNMGTGMVAVVPEEEGEKVLSLMGKHGVKAQVIGKVVEEPGVRLHGERLDYSGIG